MINIKMAKLYCKEYWKIENYADAVNDTTQTWDVHHRREITENKTSQQLMSEGLYYDVAAEDLIFLTKSEHTRLHSSGERHLGGKPKKSVRCLETGDVFESLTEAARHYNLGRGHIQCCDGKLKTTGKLHWSWTI